MEYISPPLKFADATGLAGLHTPWAMPHGLSHAQCEAEHRALLAGVMRDIGSKQKDDVAHAFVTSHVTAGQAVIAQFDKLLTLNPDLAPIAFARQDPILASIACIGVTSQFNIDDIAYFLNKPKDTPAPIDNFRRELETRTGHTLGWIASRETMFNIRAQLNKRTYQTLYKNDTADPGTEALQRALNEMIAGTDYLAPALDYEYKTGLHDLHKAWTLPGGISHKALDTRGMGLSGLLMHGTGCRDADELKHMLATSHKHLADRSIAQFDELLALNPELRVFKSLREDPQRAETIICGVTSQLNAEDMAFFMAYLDGADISAAREKCTRIEERTGEQMSWVASPKTMDKMEAQLNVRPSVTGIKKPGAGPGF